MSRFYFFQNMITISCVAYFLSINNGAKKVNQELDVAYYFFSGTYSDQSL